MAITALITGGTSGIGLGIAKAFSAKGYNIVLNGLEPEGAEITRQLAEKANVQHLFSSTDLSDPKAIRAFAADALEQFGTIDILVNNAGIQTVAPIEEFPEDRWDAILAINLSAAFHMTKALWPAMKSKGFGRIINIASAHGLVASEFKSAYVASKHGLVGFTKTIALEGAPFGITANAICPGYVHTAIIDKQIPEQMKTHQLSADEVVQKIMLEKQAIKKFNSIDSIAQMAVFLSSDTASTITGTALPIDGGWTAQ